MLGSSVDPPDGRLLISAGSMSEGTVLAGRYRLIERLGAGAMGSVWRAEDLNLRAPVAIKLIDPGIAGSTEAIARFRREAQAAAAIRSTYVVQILDHGVDANVPYIAMELLTGESLAGRLTRLGTLAPQKTVAVLSQVARALQLAHSQGIVHRDLKPDNVFLVSEGSDDIAKVLDFGIARRSGDLGATGGVQTQTGAVLGTPYYMSPEQTIGQVVDHRSDIWSFGVIAFECLTGKRPFESETFGGLFNAICVAPLPTPSQVGRVPAGFDAWFAKAVARDREQRWQSIDEAIAQLRVVCGIVGDNGSANAHPGAPSPAPRTDNFALAETAAPASVTIHHRAALSAKRLIVGVASLVLVVSAAAVSLFWRTSSTKSAPAVTSAAATTTLASSVSLELTSASAAPRIEPVPTASAREETASNSAAGMGGAKSSVSSPRAPARTRRPAQPGRSNDEFVGF